MKRRLITRDELKREWLIQDIAWKSLVGAAWILPTLMALTFATALCFYNPQSDMADLQFSLFSAAFPIVVRFAVDRSLPAVMAIAYLVQFALLLWLGPEICEALIHLRQQMG